MSAINRQHDGDTLFVRQLQQRGLNLLAQFIRGCRNVGIILHGGFAPTCVEPFAPLLAAFPIEAGVDGDAVKPRGKLGSAVERIQLLVRADESFLREILAIGHQAGHAICERVNHLLVRTDEFRERRMVAFSALRYPVLCFIRVAHCGLILTDMTAGKEQSFEILFRENSFDHTPIESYAVVMRGELAKAFQLTSTGVLRRAVLPKSYTDRLGRSLFLALLTIQGLGAFALITLGVMLKKFRVASSVVKPQVRQEISRAGAALMPLFFFVALALGFVVVGQTVSALAKLGQTDYLGSTMVIVIVRELGPLLTAMLVLARVGTANVIELGTARALGEVEALEALGIDPVHYLIVPRVIGMALGIFSLTIYLILGALASGYLFAFLQDVPLTPGDYLKQIAGALNWLDFALLALKTVTFGFFIAIVTCYHGLAQPLRLEDVSSVAVRAVTQGVVVCVMIDAIFIVLYLVT